MPITKKCEICGSEFTRSPALSGKCCSKKCGYTYRRKQTDTKGRQARQIIYKPSHPLTGKNGYLSLSRFLLFNKIGMGPHKCHWCKKKVKWIIGKRQIGGDALNVDHIDNNSNNNHISNLVQSCQSCNIWRKRQNELVKDDEDFTVRGDGYRRRTKHIIEVKMCLTCGKQFKLNIKKHAKENRAEIRKSRKYCSHKCYSLMRERISFNKGKRKRKQTISDELLKSFNRYKK